MWKLEALTGCEAFLFVLKLAGVLVAGDTVAVATIEVGAKVAVMVFVVAIVVGVVVGVFVFVVVVLGSERKTTSSVS